MTGVDMLLAKVAGASNVHVYQGPKALIQPKKKALLCWRWDSATLCRHKRTLAGRTLSE